MRTRIIITLTYLIVLFTPYRVNAQCGESLDGDWTSELQYADSLINTEIKENYVQAVKTLRIITMYLPDYAPAFRKLGWTLFQLAPTYGIAILPLAEKYYVKYKDICPDSAKYVDAEIEEINIKMREYERGPYKNVGIWGVYNKSNEFIPYVDIAYDGRKYSFNLYSRMYKAHEPGETLIYSKFHADTVKKEIVYSFESKMSCGGCYYGVSEHADSGYPKTGTKYMEDRIVYITNSIEIRRNGVRLNFLKYHEDRYIDGRKSYAETWNRSGKRDLMPAPKEYFEILFDIEL